MADGRERARLLRLAEQGDENARQKLMDMEAAERASAPDHVKRARKRAAAERAAILRNTPRKKAPPTLEDAIGTPSPQVA